MEYKIKQIREKRKMTQAELAKKAGVSRNLINRLETGSLTSTTTTTLMKIAKALNTKVTDIFF